MRGRFLPLLVVAATALVAFPDPVRSDAIAVEEVDYVDGWTVDLTPQKVTGYRKGKKVQIQVIAVGYAWIEVATGKAFLAMREAALADGVELYVWSGFRSMERQRELYRAWKEGWGNKAGRPGHSNHQLGKALDIYLGATGAHAWLVANAKKFGFKATVKGEPWHWEYVKKPAKKKPKRKRATR